MRKFLERLGDAYYGYGWRSYDYAGHRIVGHRGGVNGYRSLILFDPPEERRGGAVEQQHHPAGRARVRGDGHDLSTCRSATGWSSTRGAAAGGAAGRRRCRGRWRTPRSIVRADGAGKSGRDAGPNSPASQMNMRPPRGWFPPRKIGGNQPWTEPSPGRRRTVQAGSPQRRRVVRGIRKIRGDGRKQKIAQEICLEFWVHATIEEEIFYPALRR